MICVTGELVGRIYPSSHSIDILSSMSKRLVDIDEELLREASAVLGASTMKEAVNRSLETVVLTARRRRHGERLETMEGLDLDNLRSWPELGAERPIPCG